MNASIGGLSRLLASISEDSALLAEAESPEYQESLVAALELMISVLGASRVGLENPSTQEELQQACEHVRSLVESALSFDSPTKETLRHIGRLQQLVEAKTPGILPKVAAG